MLPSPSQTKTQCTHCDLPVPAGLIVEDREQQFCCSGCEAAWTLIHDNGLDAFYKLAQSDSSRRSRKNSAKAIYADFDQQIFVEKYVTAVDDDESKVELAVEGMHCAACLWLIEKLPSIVPGVLDANVNWGRRTVAVLWQHNVVPLSQIAAQLERLGYPPMPLRQSSTHERWKKENRTHLSRIGVAAACAGNNMVISAAMYLGMFSHMTDGMTQLMRIASGVVGIVALLWPGRTFLNSALAAIRTRTPHMDLPIALALFVGTFAGIANVLRGTGEIYFDSLAVLIFLLLVGRWFQFRQQAKAADSVELLHQLMPQRTRKIVNGEAIEILVELVEVNDILEVRCGDLFPVDGFLIDQETLVDESILSGESRPVQKLPGDRVLAGATNVGSSVTMKVSDVGDETRLGQIVSLVEEASNDRPQVVQWANQIGGYFVVAVIILATATFFWWLNVSSEVAIDRTIALLIVACPCALALATPLAIAVALGRAAGRKIMVKGGDVFQSLQRPGMIWLDKTGTITDGEMRIGRWYGSTMSLLLFAALESRSTHPAAKAILQHCSESLSIGSDETAWADIVDSFEAKNVVNHPGLGVSGSIDGRRVAIGSRSMMLHLQIPHSTHQQRIEQRIIQRGGSPCWFAVDGQVVAIGELIDSVRPEANIAINALQNRGWQVGILSGDHQEVVNRVATGLGIESQRAIGGATPEEKLFVIESSSLGNGLSNLQTQSHSVLMVGDGVNDSAALAAATVGIAVKGSAEASLSAAPVYLAETGLNPILNLMALSDSTTKTMRLNLAVSLVYNLGFASLAFLGYINPLIAAILMPISSLTVIALSMSAGNIDLPYQENGRIRESK